MTATQQFIEDAIQANYFKGIDPDQPYEITLLGEVGTPYTSVVIEQGEKWSVTRFTLGAVLLIPEFWRAVGKTRGWRYEAEDGTHDGWRKEWHTFINWLADGNTIEEALTKLITE